MSDSTKLVHRAIDLSDAEDYLGAVRLLSQAILADPANAQAYFERGIALMNLNKDADAMADFDRALAVAPGFPGALEWRARAAETLGDHQSAAEDRLKDLRQYPDGRHRGMGVNPQSWANCAEAFINAGDHHKAQQLLDEFFAEHAGKVSSYTCYETAPMRMLARLLIQTGDAMRARQFAHRAYASKHRCPSDVLAYALALEACGDVADARQVCAEALKINDQMHGLKELKERLGMA